MLLAVVFTGGSRDIEASAAFPVTKSVTVGGEGLLKRICDHQGRNITVPAGQLQLLLALIIPAKKIKDIPS